MGIGEGIAIFHKEDFLLVPIYLLLILAFALVIRNLYYRESLLKKYLIPGLLVKLFGGIAIGFIYGFYYRGGDTFYYYNDAKSIYLASQKSMLLVYKLLILPVRTVTLDTYEYTWWMNYFNHDAAGWTTVKIIGLTSIVSFYSYPVMAMMMSLLSFSGVWALFRTFSKINPSLTKQFAYAILFVPSVFFWGSGILKDSVSLGCLGWITFLSYQIFFKGRAKIMNVLFLVLICLLALSVKPYIVISFLPAMALWTILTYRSRIGNQFLRILIGPAMAVVAIVFGYLLIVQIGEEYSSFSIRNVTSTAGAYQQWHGYLAEHGQSSGYSLGQVNTSDWKNILSKFPIAVNVTLFRPYLWEARNPVMILAALESLGMMLFTIYIFWKNGIIGTLRAINKNPTVLFCLFFSLFFAFAVGFTAYNFGALVRYKIPCIPFFLCGLIILNDVTRQHRKKIAEERAGRLYKPRPT